jgi:glutathione S-transferase
MFTARSFVRSACSVACVHSASAAPLNSLRASAQIYGLTHATCTQRLLAAGFEVGAEIHINKVDLASGEQKQPAHLARNPFGVIPALVDGDFTLYESRAITRYINDINGSKLTPSDPKKRAIMEQWLSLEAGDITPKFEKIAFQRVFALRRGLVTDEAAVAQAVKDVSPALDIMDAHLAKNAFLAGEQFTLADVFYLPYFAFVYTKTPEKHLLESRPNLLKWWTTITARESWYVTHARRVAVSAGAVAVRS